MCHTVSLWALIVTSLDYALLHLLIKGQHSGQLGSVHVFGWDNAVQYVHVGCKHISNNLTLAYNGSVSFCSQIMTECGA